MGFIFIFPEWYASAMKTFKWLRQFLLYIVSSKETVFKSQTGFLGKKKITPFGLHFKVALLWFYSHSDRAHCWLCGMFWSWHCLYFRVTLLTVIGVWTVLTLKLFVLAQRLERWVENNVHNLSGYLVGVFLSPSTTSKGDIETVSVHPSVIPSICSTKESHLTATIFHQSLPNFYSMFISMNNFIICSFIKKWQKVLSWQPFFFLSFNAYLPMFVPYIKA